MQKRQQQFSIGYFVLALIIILGLQTYFATATVEPISYSEFKSLVKNRQVANLVIGDKTIRGEIKPDAVKQALPAERLKNLEEEVREGKKSLPFVVVRVEDPELIADLENAGVSFKGEVTSEWLTTVLSW